MDESSERSGTQGEPGSEGGEGGATVPCVVNRLQGCRLHELVRCLHEFKGGKYSTTTELSLNLEMKSAFLECIRSEFTAEHLFDRIVLTDLFVGKPFRVISIERPEIEIMGYCILATDHGGNYMVVYYTSPCATSRVGTLGYTMNINDFFQRFDASSDVEKRELAYAHLSFSSKSNLDEGFHSEINSIAIPKSTQSTPGLLQKSFKTKFKVSDYGHPYSLVIHTTAMKIGELFTALHSAHVLTDMESEDLKGFIRYCYRVGVYACSRLDALNTKLSSEGGVGIRSLEYFYARRFANQMHYKEKNLRIKDGFKLNVREFIDSIDKEIYRIFFQSRACNLFLVCGQDLIVGTGREHRAEVRSRKKKRDDLDDEDSDSEDETGGLVFRRMEDIPKRQGDEQDDLDEDNDPAGFDQLLITQLASFFIVMSSVVMDFTKNKVLEMFSSGGCVEDTEAHELVILAKTVKAIHQKIQLVGNRIVGFQFIPDFLIKFIPKVSKFSAIIGHLKVLHSRFPECVWSAPPASQEQGIPSMEHDFHLFREHLLHARPVLMPPESELISACRSIINFMGVTCEDHDTVVTAVRLVLEGGLGARRNCKGKSKKRSKREPLRNPSEIIGDAAAEGGEAVDGRDARRGRSTRSAGNIETDEPEDFIVGSRTRAEVNPENIMSSTKRERLSRTANSLPTQGGTMMFRPLEGFEIPQLKQFYTRTLSEPRGHNNTEVDNPMSEVPSCEFFCPDISTVHLNESDQRFTVPYEKCEVLQFMKFDCFQNRIFALIIFTDIDVAPTTYVEVQLIRDTRQNGGNRRQIGAKKYNGVVLVYNVNVSRPRRSKIQSLEHEQDGQPEGVSSFVLSITDSVNESETQSSSQKHQRDGTAGRIRTSPGSGRGEMSSASGGGSANLTISGGGTNRTGTLTTSWDRLLEDIANPLECGKMFCAKLVSDELVIIDPEALFKEYSETIEPSRQARRGRRNMLGGSYNDCDGDSGDEGGCDADYNPHRPVKTGGGLGREDDPPQETLPNTSSVAHANAPFMSIEQFRKAAVERQYTILNPVTKFCAVFNPGNERTPPTVLLAPCDGLPRWSVDCVHAFLRGIPEECRVLHGPFYLQFQNFDDYLSMEPLHKKSVTHICSLMFQPTDFRVLKTETGEGGKEFLTSSGIDLFEYLSQTIPGMDEGAQFKLLFQLCPENHKNGDPLYHSSDQCSFKVSDICQGVEPLENVLFRKCQPNRCVTAANASCIPVPGCKWLFNDIPERDNRFHLLCKDDKYLSQGGDALKGKYVYAIEMLNGKYSGRWIESTYYSSLATGMQVDAGGAQGSAEKASGSSEDSD